MLGVNEKTIRNDSEADEKNAKENKDAKTDASENSEAPGALGGEEALALVAKRENRPLSGIPTALTTGRSWTRLAILRGRSRMARPHRGFSGASRSRPLGELT